jgi:hypothetical protein
MAQLPRGLDEKKENTIKTLMDILADRDPFPRELEQYHSNSPTPSSNSDMAEDRIPPLPEITPPPMLDKEATHLCTFLSQPECSPPDSAGKCKPPAGYFTLMKNGERNPKYWNAILQELLNNYANKSTTYQGIPIPLFAGGPNHARFFIGHKRATNDFIIGPTKKRVATLITH